MQRSHNNQQRLLTLLRDETWTDAPNASQWLNLSLSATYKLLARLEQKGWIKVFYVEDLKYKIWGITPDGLLRGWHEDETMQVRPYFQPSRIKPVMMQHHLDLQKSRFKAEQHGWKNWHLGSLLPKEIGKRPDAVVTSKNGQTIAIELERTTKTKKRYEVIFSHYLQAIKRGEYDVIHYVCPDPVFATGLRRLFNLIETVPVAGERVKIKDKHRQKLPVFSLESWLTDQPQQEMKLDIK